MKIIFEKEEMDKIVFNTEKNNDLLNNNTINLFNKKIIIRKLGIKKIGNNCFESSLLQ